MWYSFTVIIVIAVNIFFQIYKTQIIIHFNHHILVYVLSKNSIDFTIEI